MLLLVAALLLGPSCAGVSPPVPGPVIAGFAPVGRYAGHWGLDLAVPTGTPVAAVMAGRVTFAGTVAGNLTVTVRHPGGLRTSYSYLEAVDVAAGDRVPAGAAIARSGRAHGAAALHLSLRVGENYVDPLGLFRCGPPAPGLRLAAGDAIPGPAAPILAGVRRGILGGTFDPPHLVHLIAGETAVRALDLDVVNYIPAGSPWQKQDRRLTSDRHRWAMVERAVEGVEYFLADDREIRRSGPTYTIDTLAEFPADELVLILGADAAAGLPTWREWKRVIASARVAVVPRTGVAREAVEALGVSLDWLDMPELNVSGTDLRRRAAAGASLRFYVREPVWRYIVAEGLYGPN